MRVGYLPFEHVQSGGRRELLEEVLGSIEAGRACPNNTDPRRRWCCGKGSGEPPLC